MKILAILFTLLFVCVASASGWFYDDHGINLSELQWEDGISIVPPCRKCLCDGYKFNPMKDITAYEIAIIIPLLWSKGIDDLTCEEFRSIRRHLKCSD